MTMKRGKTFSLFSKYCLRLLGISLCLIVLSCSGHSDNSVVEQYEYDKEGRLIYRIARDGSKIKYEYNNQGLPAEIQYPDGPVRYGYDASGNRIWMQNKTGRTEYKYDAFDRLSEVIFKYSPEKRVLYEYDAWDRISSIKIFHSQEVSYEVKYAYNIFSNIVGIDDGSGRIEYSYHPDKGEIIRKLPNGIKSIFSFSPSGELTALRHLTPQNRLIASYRYEYYPPGKISRVFEETPDGLKATGYEWDSRGYLKTLHLPDGSTVGYEYDAMGNRILATDSKGSITYKYDNLGRLLQARDIKYDWDKNGNLIAQIGKNGKTTFRYDSRNLLSLAKTPEGTTRYTYDADGNMIARWKDKEPTYFLPDPLAPPGFTLAEFDKTGKLTSSYLYGDALVGQRDMNGNIKYFLEDGFNSIRHVTDMKGEIIGQRDYTPFGESINIKGDIDINFRMMGERFLPEIKTYLISGRLYEPETGRYLTPDSFPGYMERVDSYSKYAHGCRAPSIFMEPRCNQTKKRLNIFIGGIVVPPQELKRIAIEHALTGTITTSLVERTPFPSWIETPVDWGRAFLNYLGVPGGKGDVLNQLRNYQDQNPGSEIIISAHSNGVITIYNLREALAKDIKDGRLNIKEIRIAGAGLGNELQAFFNKKGLNVRVIEDNPANRFSDIVRIFTTPQKELGSEVGYPLPIGRFLQGLFIKLGGVGVWATEPFRHGELIGTGYHSINTNYPGLFVESKNRSKTEKGIGLPTVKPLERELYLEKRRRRDEYYLPPPICPPFCCPPFCGDDSSGTAGVVSPLAGGFNDPFKSVEAKLGGITLSATAEFAGVLGKITGAFYDPEKQVLVLIGDESISVPSVKPEDLAVALLCVFGPNPQDPQFSLDPADPRNPRGEWLKAVYIPQEIIQGTPFGQAMFVSDWLLKQYAFNVVVDKEGRKNERKSSVPNFKSMVDLSFESRDSRQSQESWARQWIQVKEHKIPTYRYGNSIEIAEPEMVIKAKKQIPDPASSTGLRDVEVDDPVATAFAETFTRLYNEISMESPEFARVQELCKVVALANWLKKEHVPVDLSWVVDEINKHRIRTVERVSALSVKYEKKSQTPFSKGNAVGVKTLIEQLHLFGGVDGRARFDEKSDNGSAKNLQQAVLTKLKGKMIEPTFDIEYDGKSYRGTILPVTRNGQEIWKKSPPPSINGIRYQFDSQGQVVKSTDREGNITEYVWGANHRLNEFKTSTKDGWVILGSKKNGYSELSFTNPLKNTFLYRYSPLGYINEMMVNGQRYAAVGYREGDVTINYGNFVERAKFDNQGRLLRYETYSSLKGPPSGGLEALDITYDKNNNIIQIETPDTGPFKFTYSGRNIETFSSRQGTVDYSYDMGGNRINHINTSWGEAIKYNYEGNSLTGITYQNGDYYKNVMFKNGLPFEEKDSSGESVRYKYTSTGLLEQVADSSGSSGNYIYDNQNRLKTISLPDGFTLNFQYEEYQPKEAKESSLKKVKVTYIGAKKASSPISGSKDSISDKGRDISQILTSRLEDIKEAGSHLRDGLIIDVFIGEKDTIHVNLVDKKGNVQGIDLETSKELRRLLKSTSTTEGKIGSSLLDRWQKFYETNLSHMSKPTSWTCPDGREVKIKPVLVIKTNEVNYKYANLEKVPILADNFIIFIASKTKETSDTSETTAKNLVAKINNIPKLTLMNVAFIIRLPQMSKDEQSKWYKEIGNLQRLIDKDNVLVDPSKEEFDRMLRNRGKDIIAIELTHTEKGILLKNGERYTSKDIKQGGDLSHIKYLVSGIGTCNLPLLEKGKFAASLRGKGVGIINGSYKEVSSEVAFEKLRDLINVLENITEYDLYPYQLIDIIDQRLGIPGEGTINLGKRDSPENCLKG